MHILSTAILDRKVEEAVRRFSTLPYQAAIFSYNLYEQIISHGQMFLKTYIDFLQTAELIPKEFSGYYKRQLVITDYNTALIDQDPEIDKDTREAVLQVLADTARYTPAPRVPLFYRYNTSSEMMLISGITLREESTSKTVSLLHQTGIPVSFIEFKAHKSNYLVPLLEEYQRNPNISVRQLASKSGRSYKLLQKECRMYFGTTFHSFFLKLRMLDVLNDLMFTDLSLKEIAFKNDFSDYSNMYRRFNKQYLFPLQQVPRFLSLI
jgi:AraC-like DNA-binding protein